MKHTLKFAALALAVVLAGCSATGDYTGTQRGLDWNVETPWGSTLSGRSTTYKHETEKPLGTLTVGPNGGMDMTGPGVEIWARMMFCDKAPGAAECNEAFAP